MVDACYSGCWTERLKDEKYSNYRVIIQTSTQANELSVDTEYGGAFLCYWLKKQFFPDTKIKLEHCPTLYSTIEEHESVDVIDCAKWMRLFAPQNF